MNDDKKRNGGLSGDWTATTGRHIAAFCGMNKAEFIRLPVL